MNNRCVKCTGRLKASDGAAHIADFASHSEDQFVVEAVLQPIAQESGSPKVWEHVHYNCFLDMIESARQKVEGQTLDTFLG